MQDLVKTSGLFENFEVNRQPFWPMIGKLLGGSVFLHVVVVACVIFVPPIRDALRIVAIFSDAGFVDRPYSKTQIADNAELISMTTDQFRYPDGYWALDAGIPIPPVVPTPFVGQPPPMATPFPISTPLPVPSPTPAIAAIASPSPGGKQVDQTTPNPQNGDAKAVETAQKTLDKTAEDAGIDLPKEGEINKRPFKDLATYADELKNAGKLDINQPFEIVINTQLNDTGKLVNPQITKKAGDANLTDLAGRLVTAMNDSGLLVYLKRINKDNPGTKVVFTIRQSKDEVVATVESEASTNSSARGLASAFNLLLAAGAVTRKGKDEEVLLKKTTVSPNGKKIIFNLAMPRQDVVDLIKKGIASASPTPSPS